MISWAASSEMLVMFAVLGFALWELVKIRRILRRDREKLKQQRTEDP